MHVFEVWAPRASTMDVKIGNKKFPLGKKPRGYWSAAVEEAGPGTDYGFVIDGLEPALPDPRSQWQPCGVRMEGQRLAGAASLQRTYLRAASGHVHTGGNAASGRGPAGLLERPGRDPRRADAHRKLPRQARMGLRRCGFVCDLQCLRRAR